MAPTTFVPLGRAASVDGRLAVSIPRAIAAGQRLLELRLVPPGATVPLAVEPMDDEERQHLAQLRALGYVE
jgi:hypothetical protein